MKFIPFIKIDFVCISSRETYIGMVAYLKDARCKLHYEVDLKGGFYLKSLEFFKQFCI